MFHERSNAVTCCVGYGDFLKETVRYNARHFDKWIVVTSPEDHETREVCRQYRLHCLVSEDYKRDGTFSKGRMVERGLQHGHADGYMLHLDADIALPSNFRESLEVAHLQPHKIYGVDRFNVCGWDAWQKLQASNWFHMCNGNYPHAVTVPHGCKLGARWVTGDGWVPVGYFQLWSRLHGGEERYGSRCKPYPIHHGTACRSDVQHALQWDRKDRELIPEILVAHLESEQCTMGTNWKSRKTKRFEAPKGTQ